MIKARRLFLTPALASFLFLIPYLGVALFFIVILVWYIRNKDDLNLFFRGIEYRLNEASEKLDEQLK